MDALHGSPSIRIALPGEEGAEGEVLDDGIFGEDFGVKHLDHALVDLAPSIPDARNVE